MGRCLPIWSLALIAPLAGPGRAAEVWLQNDDYVGGAFVCVSGFAADETAAAKFTPLPAHYPFQILTVRVLACGGGQDTYVVELYADNEDSTPAPDQAIFLGEDGYVLTGDNNFYDIDLSGENLMITSGSFRASLVNVNLLVPVGFGSDTSGIQPHRNFIREAFGDWFFAEDLGVSNDFILRVEILTADRFLISGGGPGSASSTRRYQRVF
jgi:hypothetical protein